MLETHNSPGVPRWVRVFGVVGFLLLLAALTHRVLRGSMDHELHREHGTQPALTDEG